MLILGARRLIEFVGKIKEKRGKAYRPSDSLKLHFVLLKIYSNNKIKDAADIWPDSKPQRQLRDNTILHYCYGGSPACVWVFKSNAYRPMLSVHGSHHQSSPT